MNPQLRSAAWSAILALLVSTLVLVPTSSEASPTSNATTNRADFVCNFVPGVSQGVGRVVEDSGTEQNPIGIFSAHDLGELEYCVNTRSNSFSGVVFGLGNSIDLTGVSLQPIGEDSQKPFSGNFDGRGFTLANVSITVTTEVYGGLFGWIQRGKVANLILSGEVFGGKTSGTTIRNVTGLLAGAVRASVISNVHAQSSVSSLINERDDAVGGLIGSTSCLGSEISTLDRLTVTPLNGTGKVFGSGNQFTPSNWGIGAGGIVGRLWCATLSNSRSSIDVLNAGNGPAGGAVGHLFKETTISDTVAFGFVETRANRNGSLPAPRLTADSNATSDDGAATGGLVGNADDASGRKVILRSHAFGNVKGTSGFHGGLVGNGHALDIIDSGANGSVQSDGLGFVGGLAGYLYDLGNSSVIRAYASGDVEAISASYAAGLVGGVAGKYTFEDTFTRTSISVSTAVPNSFVGGFIGYFRQASTSLPQPRIVNSFHFGDVTSSAVTTRGFFGGKGWATNISSGASHWNPQGLGDSEPGVVGQTEAFFSDIDNFTGFNISAFDTQANGSTWMMCSKTPVLRSSRFQSDCPIFPRWAELSPDGDSLSIYWPGAIGDFPSTSSFQVNGSLNALQQQTASDQVLTASLSSKLPSGASVLIDYTSNPSAVMTVERSTDPSPQTVPSFAGFRAVNFSMVPGPAVASVTPSRGFFNQAHQVLLQGSNLGSATVTVDGVSVIPASNTDTEIVLNIPAGTAGSLATIVVTNSFGTFTAQDVFLRVPAPSFSSVAPASTPSGGGAEIEITGEYFSGSTAVSVAGSPVDFTVVSDTRISFSAPAGAPGSTASVAVTSPAGTTTVQQALFFNLLPSVASLSPSAGALAGGETITVFGSRFTGATNLSLGGVSVTPFTVVSDTEITFSAPVSANALALSVSVTTTDGTTTLLNAYSYLNEPVVSSISPAVGTTNGGTIVTLTGTDLVRTSEVMIGDVTVSFSVESDTLVRFVTPASSSGAVSISVTTPGGATTSPVAFEYTSSVLVPVVSTITPGIGPTAGGTTITVTGQYFSGSYSDSVSAAINGVSGSSVVLIDDSTLTFVSPPGAAASGLDVTVATGGGVGTLAGAFSYTAPPAPQTPVTQGSAPQVVINTPIITEFSTREISASGAEVTATGQRLENVSVLTLGGITVTIVSNTSTSLTFTTGEMPVGVWDLRLVSSNGTLVFQQAIEVVEATAIVAESTGELLGWTWTLKFLGNSRSLHDAQAAHLTRRLNPNAETIICWGYTTPENPNAWAIAHATQRAQAACDLASANNSEVKTVVRLRYGVSKNWAMRSALQFWR